MSEDAIHRTSLSNIKFDESNANLGSERGQDLIEASLREFGFADAGTLDRNNTLIGGNKRTEAAHEIALSGEALIIDVDGTRPVYIRRKDLDLSDPNDDRARRLAYTLNRSSELSLTWDIEKIAADMEAGLDLSTMFNDEERDEIFYALVKEADDLLAGDETQERPSEPSVAGDAPLSFQRPYAPEYSPQMGHGTVTQEALDKQSHQMETRFDAPAVDDQAELICPHCGETFFMKKAELR